MVDCVQHIAFGIVPADRAARKLVRSDRQPAEFAVFAVFEVTDERYDLTFPKSCCSDVFRTHEKHVSRTLDAAESIRIAIDRCVKLVVGSHRDQPEPTRRILERQRVELMRRCKDRFLFLGIPLPFVCIIAAIKTAGLEHPLLIGRAPYDLIIANILAGPLVELAPTLGMALAEGGTLILAGLLDTQAETVAQAYRRQGLRLAGRIDRGAWPTLRLVKRHRYGADRTTRLSRGKGEAPGFGSW